MKIDSLLPTSNYGDPNIYIGNYDIGKVIAKDTCLVEYWNQSIRRQKHKRKREKRYKHV